MPSSRPDDQLTARRGTQVDRTPTAVVEACLGPVGWFLAQIGALAVLQVMNPRAPADATQRSLEAMVIRWPAPSSTSSWHNNDGVSP